MLSTLPVLFTCYACMNVGPSHGAGAPVSWSITRSETPQGRSIDVCKSGEQKPCVLERSTPEKTNYSTFVLHVWGPSPTKFTGSYLLGYFEDNDPLHIKRPVELISNGREIHHRTFSSVTRVPGAYSVRVDLTETRDGQPPRDHNLSVPVIVQ
jgi:hypothetical protein